MHELAFPLLAGLVILALAFDFLNGLHDAANSIATVVATKLLRPVQAVAFAAFFNFAAYFLILWIPELHKVADTIGKGLIDKDLVSPGGGVRGAGRGDVLERRHLAQGHSLLVEPRTGRRDRWRWRGGGGVRNDPMERTDQDLAVHSAGAADRHGGGAGGDAGIELAARNGPAHAAPTAYSGRCTWYRRLAIRSATASTTRKRRWGSSPSCSIRPAICRANSTSPTGWRSVATSRLDLAR